MFSVSSSPTSTSTSLSLSSTSRPKIVLMVCSSIAAYKAAYLARLLTEHFEVHVVLSTNAKDFVGAPTFQGITHQKVWLDWSSEDPKYMPHIELTRQAVAIIIAPASANCMAKLANGIADDLLSTTLLARPQNCPVFLAPAMNHEMWWQAPTQRNLKQLQNDGIHILGPISGDQACGEHGMGKMMEPMDILEHMLLNLYPKPLLGKKVMITAGPTREYLDGVRYLSNDASGLMGFMLAKEAAKLGAEVDLITGPSAYLTPLGVQRFDVCTAIEMHEKVHQQIALKKPDIFIGNAAVADWRLENKKNEENDEINNEINDKKNIPSTKINKQNFMDFLKNSIWQLNPDIVKSVAALNQNLAKKDLIYCVAFAAQADGLAQYAQEKLKHKNVDMVVANHIQFINASENQVSIFKKNHELHQTIDIIDLPQAKKQTLAILIWQEIFKDMKNN